MVEVYKEPFFSVIVPVYNKEPYIQRCINSILNQTFENFELVIVCDPSADNSNSEVEKFTDPRIRVFYRDEPGPGGYAARNLAISEAYGKWIVFLDADDIYYPDHLKYFWALSMKYPDESVLSSAKLIDENGVVALDNFSSVQTCQDGVFSFLDYLKFSVLFDKPFNMNSVGMLGMLIKNNPFFPDGRTSRSGDVYAWIHLVSRAKKFVWSNHIGSHTYKDVVGVSKSNAPSMILNHEMVIELRDDCTREELIWLNKYANRLIKTAYFEQQRLKGEVEMNLLSAFYWRYDILFCILWFGVSLFPVCVTFILRKFIKTLNKITRKFR